MALPNIPAFRVLAVDDNIENTGLRSVGARRSATDPGTWDVLVRARNYGTSAEPVNVTLNFGHVPQGVAAARPAAGDGAGSHLHRPHSRGRNSRSAALSEGRFRRRIITPRSNSRSCAACT